jgi:hypothetical protein
MARQKYGTSFMDLLATSPDKAYALETSYIEDLIDK